jgi:hypothetical protein
MQPMHSATGPFSSLTKRVDQKSDDPVRERRSGINWAWKRVPVSRKEAGQPFEPFDADVKYETTARSGEEKHTTSTQSTPTTDLRTS